MGSKSDWDVMRQADEVLAKFGLEHECRVLSAHRTPKETAEYVSAAEGRGMEVLIAAAGRAGGVLANGVVEHEGRVLSAHRTPKETAEYVSAAEGRGMEVLIAAAGGGAHLAGVRPAHTQIGRAHD